MYIAYIQPYILSFYRNKLRRWPWLPSWSVPILRRIDAFGVSVSASRYVLPSHQIMASPCSRSCRSLGRWETFSATPITSHYRTPIQLTLISCKPSWNVCRQVFLVVIFFSCLGQIYCIATLTFLFDGSRSICLPNIILLDLTIVGKSSIPAMYVNSSLVMRWPRDPNMVRKHLRWKTSNMCEIFIDCCICISCTYCCWSHCWRVQM